MTASDRQELLGPLLRSVSRSFYLTLRVLPPAIRPQISIAYLLARASDTIADTQAVPIEGRLEILQQYRTGVYEVNVPLLAQQTTPGEKQLLKNLNSCFELLGTFSSDDQERIRELIRSITTGQIFDLEHFHGNSETELIALASDDELDQYTYLVAGCVGEFWTKMCLAHLNGLETWDREKMLDLAVRFGKGLQLVNILRDIPKDLRIGRCYLPVDNPISLLDPRNFPALESTYSLWLQVALEHLDAGWDYTMRIPKNLKRLRLACIWPIWIGLKTIAYLKTSNPLDPATRIKVPRAEVYRTILKSIIAISNDQHLNAIQNKLRMQTVQKF